MKKIGIYASFLSEQLLDRIRKTASEAGYSVQVYHSDQEAAKNMKDAEILYGYYPEKLIKNAEDLRWLATASAGVNTFLDDDVYAHPENVILTNSNVYGVTISEHMVMVTLMMMRRMPEYEEKMRQRRWESVGAIRSIYGSSFTIVGTGDIGTNYARRLKALGAARVTGVRRTLKKADPAFDEVTTLDHLKEAVKGADEVALCVPATSATKGLLSKEIIDSLAPTTYIVNVGRGSAIDQDALILALNEGRLAGAALDVMTPEPLPEDSPLYLAKNVILTPHISGTMSLGYTCEADVDMFVRNLRRYLAGEPLHHVIDRKIGY